MRSIRPRIWHLSRAGNDADPRQPRPSCCVADVGVNAGPTSHAEPDRAALKRRCGGDYAACCGDIPRDGPEVQACIRRNMASL